MSEGLAYLTVLEVAELARCEHKTVRRAIHLGLLPAFRPAGKLIIRERDARAWIEGRMAVVAPRPLRRRPPRSWVGSVASLREIERQAST